MNQKLSGWLLIAAGVFLAAFVLIANARENHYIEEYVEKEGTCFLEDGTCLHADKDYTIYIGGWIFSAALILLGIYMLAFDRTERLLQEQNKSIAGALKEASKKDEFNAFLAGFTDDEKAVLKAIKEQDGIQQSTLRYRSGVSKTGLSIMLKEFEKKGIISRKESGKTNQVFMRKKF